MRAPFQILAIPYRMCGDEPLFCVLHRADHDQWQFVSGGGEDVETPEEAARREIFEETGITVGDITTLTSMCHIPANIISEHNRKSWAPDTYVIPEYTFGFECADEMFLSHEHTECVWLTYADARDKLTWDSNKTALYELSCRLEASR